MLSQKEKELFDYMEQFLGIKNVDRNYADATLKALDKMQPTIKIDHGGSDAKTNRKN